MKPMKESLWPLKTLISMQFGGLRRSLLAQDLTLPQLEKALEAAPELSARAEAMERSPQVAPGRFDRFCRSFEARRG